MKEYFKKHRKELYVYKRQYAKDHPRDRNEYVRNNPEIYLKSRIKRLTALGKILDLNYEEMKHAIDSWSKTVRKRDGHKCTWCNSTEKLVAHHIWHKVILSRVCT